MPQLCITVVKYSRYLRTLEKCRKHLPAACGFYVSLVFTSCFITVLYTWLRLLYLWGHFRGFWDTRCLARRLSGCRIFWGKINGIWDIFRWDNMGYRVRNCYFLQLELTVRRIFKPKLTGCGILRCLLSPPPPPNPPKGTSFVRYHVTQKKKKSWQINSQHLTECLLENLLSKLWPGSYWEQSRPLLRCHKLWPDEILC